MSHVRQCRQGGFRYTGLNVDAAPRSPVDNIEPRAIERCLRVQAIVREGDHNLHMTLGLHEAPCPTDLNSR